MNPPEPQPEIEVLLATFNGDRFLSEQIDSILTQDYPTLRILARDDGSTDQTPAILAEYAEAHPTRLRVLPHSRPTGSAKANFLALMHSATAPYLAFSDQDDVWLPTKLSQSMAAMMRLEAQHPPATPLLVFTDLRIVDDRLRPLHPSFWKHLHIDPRAIHRLPGLLGRSVVTGCTMLINRAMLDLARHMPPEAAMHDRWIGLLAASLGAAAFIPEPTVLYRQHDRNVVGAAPPGISLSALTARMDSRGRRDERLLSQRQADALLRLHNATMPTANAQLIQRYLLSGRSPSRYTRIALTLRYRFFRGGLLKNLALLLDLFRFNPAR